MLKKRRRKDDGAEATATTTTSSPAVGDGGGITLPLLLLLPLPLLLRSRAEQTSGVGGRLGPGRRVRCVVLAVAAVPLHGLEPAESGERVALETGLVHFWPALHRVEPVETAGERIAVESVGVHLGPALGRRSLRLLLRLAQSDAAATVAGVLVQAPQQVCHGRRRSRHRPVGSIPSRHDVN